MENRRIARGWRWLGRGVLALVIFAMGGAWERVTRNGPLPVCLPITQTTVLMPPPPPPPGPPGFGSDPYRD